MGERILRIDGLEGEFLELTDVTPADNPEGWKPRWFLRAESAFTGANHYELAMGLWDCEPAWLELFTAELSTACSASYGEVHLSTSSLPDVDLKIKFERDTGEALVTLGIWDADQKIEIRFHTDDVRLEATLADLGASLAE